MKLAADTRLTEVVAVTEDSATGKPTGPVAGSLFLAAGTEGTVERAVAHRHESHGVREYARLKSLLDTFGQDMPTQSRKQLEEQVGGLEPEWIAFQQERPRVTVRVRFDNGFILDDTDGDLFTSA
ncbi:hypothetical protein ACFWBF_20970 [Streptomyces sp. NPDC060028]|uniref:hypothetical protein n=1 Tax=Streptomyces sp. NPDC060028 TaxID=3347041 RepID=UPI0036979A72